MATKKARRSSAKPIWIHLAFILILFTLPKTGLSQDKSTLPFVHSSADIVMSTRPAMIMRSDDYQDLKRKGGKHLDNIVNRLTDSYFKFSLAEIQEIDQVIYATSIPDREAMNAGATEMYNVMVLRTVRDNTTGFDMVTQDINETFDYRGEEYFEFKKPVNYMYRYVYIADKKTIVWGQSKTAIELSIDAGTKGPQSAEWYKLWKEFSAKPFSMALKVRPMMTQMLHPPLAAFKKVQMVAGGADVARETRVKVKAVCLQEADAREVVKAVEQGLEMARTSLESQKDRMKASGQEAANVVGMDLIEATKINSNRKTVELDSVIKIDFDAIVPMFESSYLAAQRTRAANNLRQVTISFHNYHDANKKFPTPVMVHESGKKYSWRIAILPYIEENELYEQYDFNQEWNSPHNREITSRMPDVFRSGEDEDTTNTSWFMLSGPDGVFDGEHAMTLEEISNGDGTSNTIIAVEAKRNVHWAKPEDIQIDAKRGLPKLGGFHKGGFNVAMADASIQFVPEKTDSEVLWGLYTASGGEAVDTLDLKINDK